ncbi:MAG: methylisocitrate lyase, partial [Plesiomonas shigelloides]
PEAMQTLAQYRRFASAVGVPVLANITEFGQTPLFECRELGEQGVAMVLYPLTAFRAMNRAAERVYQHLAQAQSQVALVEQMQTRAELYHYLDYLRYEQTLDRLFSQDAEKSAL